MDSVPPSGRPTRAVRTRWRYRFIVALIWVAVLAAAAAGWRYARSSGPAFGPIIVVSIEGLRADHLPIYGYEKVRTPAIDALAADAVSFDRAYAHVPLTWPSHVAILSGQLPYQSGIRDEIGFTLGNGVALLPQLLHKRGFKTGGVVSSLLLRKETGLGQAFGFFDDERTRRDGAQAVKVAEQWIDTIKTGRFFLFLHIDDQLPGAQEPGLTAPNSSYAVSHYDARLARVDQVLGEFIAFLKKRGLYNGGVIVLTSDHGEGLGEHAEQGHGLFLYESAVRVPLVVKLPRRDGGGRHSAALVQHIDIAPTVLDLVGAPRPSALLGRSLRSILDSPTAVIPPRQVYAETMAPRYRFGWSEAQSLTDDRLRYIKSVRPELYDLQKDPGERKDLVAADPAAAEPLRLALEKMTNGRPTVEPGAMPEPERSKLAAAGYLAPPPPAAAAPATELPPAAAAPANETPATPAPGLPDAKDRVGVYNDYWTASALAAEGRANEAVRVLRDVVAADPKLAIAWSRLATLLFENGQWKSGAEATVAFVELAPEPSRAALAEERLAPLLAEPAGAEAYVAVVAVWTSLGEKAKAAEIRAHARKAVGEAALRKAEAAIRPAR